MYMAPNGTVAIPTKHEMQTNLNTHMQDSMRSGGMTR